MLSHLMLIAVSWKDVCMRLGACTRRGEKISKLADGMRPSRIVHRGHRRPAVLLFVRHLQRRRQHMQSRFDLPSSPLRCSQPDELRQCEPLCPSYPTCASVASAWGSQKVMSMMR